MKVPLCCLSALLLAAAALTPTITGQAQDIPDEAYVCCVYGTPQTFELSCEARAAVDWAAFFGYSIAEYDFMAALPQSDNPEKGFVGLWNGIYGNIPPDAYGVHPPPVAETLRSFGVPAEAYSGLTWDDLRMEIAAGRPVIIWVISQMWPGTPIEYTAEDGETVIVAHNEHTMILTGYDTGRVYVVDPGNGQNKSFLLQAFLTSWAVLGNRAVLSGELESSSAASDSIAAQPEEILSGAVDSADTYQQRYTTTNTFLNPNFIYIWDVCKIP